MSISLLCRIADVSRKSYYCFLKQPAVTVEDTEILEIIARLQKENFNGIGYRNMTTLVSGELGYSVNRKHIYRLMRDNDLLSAVRRRRWSDEVYARRKEILKNVPPDLIGRWFFALEPRKRLVEDITYLYGKEHTEYLNTIEDLFNGEILSYSISTSPDSKLCVETLDLLVSTWGEGFKDTILHSDLGSSYMSCEYMNTVKSYGMRLSTGKKGSCYDNAAMESLNGIIKTEGLYCRFGKTRIKNRKVPIDDIVKAVVEFIEYYNNRRPKDALGGLSPVEFRTKNPRGTYPVVI